MCAAARLDPTTALSIAPHAFADAGPARSADEAIRQGRWRALEHGAAPDGQVNARVHELAFGVESARKGGECEVYDLDQNEHDGGQCERGQSKGVDETVS